MSTYNEYYYEARADSINMNDLTPHPHNAGLLRQLKENDPELTEINVKVRVDNVDTFMPGNYYHSSESDPDAAWLGYFIGKNSVLKKLRLDVKGLGYSSGDIQPFCRGISLNRSIQAIVVALTDGQIFRGLVPFFKNNHQLTSIWLMDCDLGTEGIQMLSQAIASCKANSLRKVLISSVDGSNTAFSDRQMVNIILALSMQSNLQHLRFLAQNMRRNSCIALTTILRNKTTNLEILSLCGNSFDDECVEALASSLYGSNLRELNLGMNPSVSTRGLRSISMLPSDRNSNLESLTFHSNNIGDDGALVLASALTNNKKLRELNLRHNQITARGEQAFHKVVCDTSSIEKTFLSNHTLCEVVDVGEENSELHYYLGLNLNEDKNMVAAVKILESHRHFIMQPFLKCCHISLAGSKIFALMTLISRRVLIRERCVVSINLSEQCP